MSDRLLFEPKHEILAKAVLDKVKELIDFKEDNLNIICIGGKSGTGKTEVAFLLKELLKENKIHSYLLSLDNFYNVGHEYKRIESNYKTVGIEEIDWDRLKRSVHNVYNTKGYSLIIIEGLSANIVDEKTVGFYISQSYEDSYDFRKKRGKENPDCPKRKIVLEKEGEATRTTKQFTDFILTYEN